MPDPYEHQTLGELVQTLKNKKIKLSAWFQERVKTISNIVYNSVGNNTFRAFHNKPKPPSIVYRNWAEKILRERCLSDLKMISSENEYDRFSMIVS